jgi:hypothetical protein
MAVIVSCMRMLPRLNAEEGIAAFMYVALGTGSVDKDESKEIRRTMRHTADGVVEPRHRLRRRRRPKVKDAAHG